MSRLVVSSKPKPQHQWKAPLVFGGGLLALLAVLFLNITQGEANITVHTVVSALLDPQDTPDHHMVRGLRLPRAVIGLLAGASLAVAGALLQTVTRNPLASASTLGLNAGAYFIIVLAAVYFPGIKSDHSLILALIGACGAAVMAYFMSGGRQSTPLRMALAGMIVTLVLSAFTSGLQIMYENETNGLYMWGSGALAQNDWLGVRYALPWVLIGLIVAALFNQKLDMLELSEDTAVSLGEKVNVIRFVALAAAILLAGVTVSVVGPIGFVGLIAPHLIRLIGLRRHRFLLPGSAIWGAVVLIGADTIAKMFRSTLGELPAGSVTAVLGAPWLIWLAVRGSRMKSSADGGSTMGVGYLGTKVPYGLLVTLTTAALFILILCGLSAGALSFPITDVLAVLTGSGSEMAANVILNLRLPRVLVAALAGASLAIAGSMMQGAVRNPLADPSVVGVTTGAGMGALLVLTIWPSASGAWVPVGAMAGALLSAGSVYALAWKKGLNPVVLILVGIAVSALGSAVIQFLIIQSKLGAAPALTWLAGSTYARGWGDFAQLSIAMAVGLPLAWLLGRRVDLLAFGDLVSLGLGLQLQRTRLIAAGIGVTIAAIAVASVGTISFIGLLAPHAVRMMMGQHHQKSVVLSAVIGAILLVVADIIGKVIAIPKEIPSGIVVAVIGAPYLLFLMYRSTVKR
ncbi:Fe(3+)-hydroxamate ABC transporter permease FhuB [Paenibacillus sp. GCM10023248]|uniref:Fe(3+)-hydroxamate ABC transporter permease FhuB n=1 Tax=Bacillales TaxID=1385 RepID=UPI002379413D|nr:MULTISPECIES: Fe(3+)-hydroxamate ABC transporter permease FhuB [Bacillales]MDD9267708.1 Fe(3+)-hydroxamate ABC transporter permease FhuB [Paenibacillus sp. MAHUQ-63]MDR6884520.1 iron complex transport system permease protein [Bacillus sp. 3255]